MKLKEQVLMLFNHLEWNKVNIYYNNNELVVIETATVNNIKISVSDHGVTTEHINSNQCFRLHKELNEIVKEVEEIRYPLFSFGMY